MSRYKHQLCQSVSYHQPLAVSLVLIQKKNHTPNTYILPKFMNDQILEFYSVALLNKNNYL